MSSAGLSDPIHPSTQPDNDNLRKKKKKRHREEVAEEEHAIDGVKKKKRRKHNPEVTAVEEEISPPVPGPSAEVLDPVLSQGDLPLKKTKSKKKGKGKGKRVPVQQAPSSQLEPHRPQSSAETSAAALLSSIVAAATGSLSQQQGSSQYAPNMMPHLAQGPHYSYPPPPMHYGFPPPHSQPPSMLSMPPSLPFSDLSFGSNEDVLRALQELDMSKIANVLKTLGEAAAAANVPLSGQPLTAGPSLPVPTRLGQVPVAASDILEHSTRQPTATHHRRTLDMNLPSTDPHTNPDHAHILANKWLNASKLADLVRTEGACRSFYDVNHIY